jgi:hypothetical protein
MMEFMVEMVITAFAFGGILGAVVALHLSANLKGTDKSRETASIALELPRNDEPAGLKRVPVDIASRRTRSNGERRH